MFNFLQATIVSGRRMYYMGNSAPPATVFSFITKSRSLLNKLMKTHAHTLKVAEWVGCPKRRNVWCILRNIKVHDCFYGVIIWNHNINLDFPGTKIAIHCYSSYLNSVSLARMTLCWWVYGSKRSYSPLISLEAFLATSVVYLTLLIGFWSPRT